MVEDLHLIYLMSNKEIVLLFPKINYLIAILKKMWITNIIIYFKGSEPDLSHLTKLTKHIKHFPQGMAMWWYMCA